MSFGISKMILLDNGLDVVFFFQVGGDHAYH